MEVALDAGGQGLDRPGLGQPGRPFHQQVAVRQQRDQQPQHQLALTEDLLLHVPAQQVELLPQQVLAGGLRSLHA